MNSKGIRILDKNKRIVAVDLPDILEQIKDGNSFNWSILYLQATGDLGEDRSIPEFEQKIIESKNGLIISWEDLNTLAKKFWEVMDITLIGCKNEIFLRRSAKDQEMYETCDIVID